MNHIHRRQRSFEFYLVFHIHLVIGPAGHWVQNEISLLSSRNQFKWVPDVCGLRVCSFGRGPHSVSSIHRPNYGTNWAWSVANTCALSQKNCPSATPKIVSRNDVFCTEQSLSTRIVCVCVDFNLFSIAVQFGQPRTGAIYSNPLHSIHFTQS